MTELGGVVDLLERQRDEGLHDGAQVYVSRGGKTLLDAAVGESAPGRPLRQDDLMLWYSSSKPSTTVAVLQLWERGHLGLDDPVGRYIDGWGNGKERSTIRMLLVHTGGFAMTGNPLPDEDVSYAKSVARIAAHPVEYEPGTKAGYHLTSSWKVLGAVVEAVDGRPIDQYLAGEVFGPAGMENCRLGIPPDEQATLGDRIVPVDGRGHGMPKRQADGSFVLVPYRVERIHNQPWYIAKVEPGGFVRGPARELGRLYESLLGFGPPLLEPRTVELMKANHRVGMRDRTFGGLKVPWGLGVQTSGGMSGGPGRRAFGHGGMASSLGLADPDLGLVFVVIANGLPDWLAHERRIYGLTDAVYSAFGEEAARFRRSAHPPPETATLTGWAAVQGAEKQPGS
jgi:CubicO group peptidase (beta-lactamase class C family)